MQFFKTSFLNPLPTKRYPKATKIRLKSMKIETKTRNRDFIEMWLFSRRQHDFEGSDVPESSPIQKKAFPKARLAFESYFFANFHQIWAIWGSPEGHKKRAKASKRRPTRTIENEVAKIGNYTFPKPRCASPLGHPGTSKGGTMEEVPPYPQDHHWQSIQKLWKPSSN